jgi:sulfatase maturation enzyme AslB (radical SAM superfamily)
MVPTAATGSGSRADRWRHALILVVTRRCNLRCAYCPTVKDGLPDLAEDDVRRAIDLFVARFGGGDLKLFGGEPLLVPDLVRAAIAHAPPSVRVYLSTNAVPLDDTMFALLEAHPEVTVTVSLDGTARDHDGLRRGGTSHAIVLERLPRLLRLPRFVVTQTIAPSTATRAATNFRFLRDLGIRRFNLLPGYYLPWRPSQLAALEASFHAIGDELEAAWASGDRLYLRNLFVRAPTPFFNTGFVVDVDRAIHPSNLILAGDFDTFRTRTAVGTLDDPPSPEALDAGARASAALLRETLSAKVLASTDAVDAALTRLCNRLYPAYFAARDRQFAPLGTAA